MARPAVHSALTPQAFLAWERLQSIRHEYFFGDVFAMAGGSPRHNALCSNITAALHGAVRPKGCLVLSSDQRLGVGRGDRYVYADVSVVRGGVQLEDGTRDVVVNPSVIVEVLSGSTEQYDRGVKWVGYQGLPSLRDYLLVSQADARIEHFAREQAGAWVYRAAESGGRIVLTSGVELAVDMIFDGVFEIAAD